MTGPIRAAREEFHPVQSGSRGAVAVAVAAGFAVLARAAFAAAVAAALGGPGVVAGVVAAALAVAAAMTFAAAIGPVAAVRRPFAGGIGVVAHFGAACLVAFGRVLTAIAALRLAAAMVVGPIAAGLTGRTAVVEWTFAARRTS